MESVGYVQGDGLVSFVKAEIPDNSDEIFNQIDKVLQIERNFYDERERKRLEELALQEEQERRRQEREARLEEKRRIEEAKREERERARREREEEEKRIQEMLERRRAEIEAERQARIEEERRIAEEEARIAAEKAKLKAEKDAIRSDFGEAVGMDAASIEKQKEAKEKMDAYNSVTWSDISETTKKMEEEAEKAAEAGEEQPEEIEDPRAVAARMKLEQQKREKEQREKDRAIRLKAERAQFEAKPFDVIRKEYSKNPVYAIPRFFMWLLFKLFGYIPADTDNPDYKKILAERAEKIRREEYERGEREKFEVYYAKYATNWPYNIKRYFKDQKFKRKRAKEAKNKPKPKWNPPVRTAEEQRAIDRQMRTLYRTYRVTPIMWISRKYKELTTKQEV